MTAIAYRDGILAADGLTSWGEIKTNSGNKIRAIQTLEFGLCLVVLSGTVRGTEALFDFLDITRNGASLGFEASIAFEGMEAASRYGIAVDNKLNVYPVFGDGYIGQPDKNHFVAEGSAFQFLMGAMAAGASAEDAVELACEHCNYCGGPVEVIDVREWFRYNKVS